MSSRKVVAPKALPNDPGLPNGWTPGRLQGFIIGVLRQGHKRWPIKIEVKNAAKIGKKVNPITGRMAEFYRCAECQGEFTNSNVEVDHIAPVVDPKSGFSTWDNFINRLFSPKDNYQVLCTTCHKDKSKAEKQVRKVNKNK